MSLEQSFLPRESGRLVETNDDTASSMLLSTSSDRRAPLPAPDDNDKAWAVAFKINVAITVISAVWALATGKTVPEDAPELEDILDDVRGHIYFFVVMAAVSYPLSSCTLRAMSSFSREILQIASVAFVVASMMLMAWLFSSGAVVGATFTGVVSAGVAHLFLRPGRVGFAAANLKVAALAVRSTPNIFLWSLCVTTIRVMWVIATGIALAGSVAALQLRTTYFALQMLMACCWMASMGWGFVVCTNIMTATVARSVALWWSSPDDVESVWRSCQLVINSSFGPLCKAAVTDSFIELLNEVFRSIMYPRSGGRLSHLPACYNGLPKASFRYLGQALVVVFGLPLLLVKLVTSYVVGYTAVFVGLYRLGFPEASGCTKELFRTVGMTLLGNQVVVGVCLLSAGLSPNVITYWCVVSLLPDDALGWGFVWLCTATVLLSFAIFLLPMVEVVLCAYKAVFVCFVQDPEALAAHHDGLNRAWQNMGLSPPPRRDTNGGFQLLETV